MLELNVYMPLHLILALTVLRPLDIMLALSYISMPTQVPSYDFQNLIYGSQKMLLLWNTCLSHYWNTLCIVYMINQITIQDFHNNFYFSLAIAYCNLEFLGLQPETPKSSYIFNIGEFNPYSEGLIVPSHKAL